MVDVDINALTTLVKVRLYLKFDDDETEEDEFLKDLINDSSAQIEKKLGEVNFKQRRYTEDHDGGNSNHLILLNRPIAIPLIEVNIDANLEFGSTTAVDLDQFVVSPEEGVIAFKGLVEATGGVFPAGEKNVRVIYDGGDLTIPRHIQLAATKLVAAHFARAREGGDGIASESIGGRTVAWVEGFPPDVWDLIKDDIRVAGI